MTGEMHVIRGGTFGDLVELELRDVTFELEDGYTLEVPYGFFRVTLAEPTCLEPEPPFECEDG